MSPLAQAVNQNMPETAVRCGRPANAERMILDMTLNTTHGRDGCIHHTVSFLSVFCEPPVFIHPAAQQQLKLNFCLNHSVNHASRSTGTPAVLPIALRQEEETYLCAVSL